jgi:general secretion pathway protein F
MPNYKYRVKKGLEGIFEGVLGASTEKEAIEKLSSMGLLPLSIEEEKTTVRVETTPAKKIRKIRSREITVFSRELASLLKSGVPILKSLQIIAQQSEDISLRIVLNELHDAVKEGSTFSSVLAKYPQVFSSLFVAMIRSGENSGSLPEVLLSIVGYRTKQEELVSRFRMALAYPLLMAFVGAGTIIFMFTFVIPRLTKMYVTMDQILPLPTRILLSTSTGLKKWWPLILCVVFLLVVFVRRQFRTKRGKKFFSLFSLRLPIFGKFILKVELSRFCRTLGLLIKNGVPILSAINIAVPVVGNDFIKEQMAKSYSELEQGGSFGKSLKSSGKIPLFMSNLISVGEESGKLQDALEEVADSYERDTDEIMRMMSSLLEPLMILIMGLIVGFIVIAMLLPIFDINAMVR